MNTLMSILFFFVMFGALFGLPVVATVLLMRRREGRVHQVLREVKSQYRLRGRARSHLAGRIDGRPLRITRDMKRGVVVAVDLLPADVRRRHAQWPRERAHRFSAALQRLLAQSGFEHAELGERIEGRWMFRLGPYPTVDAIEEALQTIGRGVSDEKVLADVAAAAEEADRPSARARLTEVSESHQPPWLRAEAYRGLLAHTSEREQLEAYAQRLSAASEPALRTLAPSAWNRVEEERAMVPLRGLLSDDHPSVVEAAARTLAERTGRGDPETEGVLLDRLKGASGPLLFVIVRALGVVGSSRALSEMARWGGGRSMSVTLRETVARESARIRMALGLKPAEHGGQLSVAQARGELSPAVSDERLTEEADKLDGSERPPEPTPEPTT